MFRPSLVSSIALALVTGCAADGEPSAASEDTFVFGLSAAEVLAAKHVAGQPGTDAEWLDMHRGDFDCERYGSLCGAVGPDAAARIIEAGYRRAIAGADADEVLRVQSEAIDVARAAWRARGITPYASDTETTDGEGASSRRLVAYVESNYLWPAQKLTARGECRTELNIAGFYFPEQSESICGTLRATFNRGLSSEQSVTTGRHCKASVSSLSLALAARAADTSTVKMSCDAENGLWTASRSADVDEYAWF